MLSWCLAKAIHRVTFTRWCPKFLIGSGECVSTQVRGGFVLILRRGRQSEVVYRRPALGSVSIERREALVAFFIRIPRPQIRRPPMRVHLRDVAAGGAHALPPTEGSRIRKVPSLDREKELLRGGPKRVDCCGSLCAWKNLETF
jgi:hypothetical protein